MTFGPELLLLAVGLLRVLPTVYCVCEGDEINTKSRVADGGFALAWMVVPTVGKRVFLRAVSTIPTVMRCMTLSAATVQKAASGRSKNPAFAGTKTADYWRPLLWPPKAPLQPSPRGGSSFLLCLRWLCDALSPWGELERGFGGASERLRVILHLIIYIRARGHGGHCDDRLNFCWHEWRWLLTEFCGLRRLLFW